MWLAGQISTRIGWWSTITVMAVYLAVFVLFFFLGCVVAIATPPTDGRGAVALLFYVPYYWFLIFLIILRYRFVTYFEIPENNLETCCIAFWCGPCSLCQMARHLYGYKKQFEGDSLLDGRMEYGTNGQSLRFTVVEVDKV